MMDAEGQKYTEEVIVKVIAARLNVDNAVTVE